MVSSPRARRKLTTHELARFLALLAETGNFALACDRLGRAKSGLYKRRVRDSLFDSECVAALAMFRLASSPAFAGEDHPQGGGRALKTTPGTVIRTTYAGRPQLRRAPPGRLTRAGLEAVLRTFAATAPPDGGGGEDE